MSDTFSSAFGADHSDSSSFEDQTDTAPAEETPKPAKADRPKTPRRAARSGGSRRSGGRKPRADVRQIVDKTLEISAAPESTRDDLAALLKIDSADIADVTTAILESSSNPVAVALADLEAIRTSSEAAAAIHIVGMERDALTALHALLLVLGVDVPDKLPAKSTEAALELTEPTRSADIDEDAARELSDLLAW